MGFAYEAVSEPTMQEIELVTIPAVEAKPVFTGAPAEFVTVRGADGRLHQVPRELMPIGIAATPIVVVNEHGECTSKKCEKQAALAALAVFVCGFFFTPIWCLGWAFVKHRSKCARKLGKMSLVFSAISLIALIALVVSGATSHHGHHGHGRGFHGHGPHGNHPDFRAPCPAATTQDECLGNPEARFCGWCKTSNTCGKPWECSSSVDMPDAFFIPHPDAPKHPFHGPHHRRGGDDNDDGDDGHHRRH